jgi:hypothetical protein
MLKFYFKYFASLGYENFKNIFLLFIAANMIFICISCDDGLFNGGETTVREIPLNDSISSVEVENIFDIELDQDTVNKIFVTCGENLQQYIDIKIKDKVLHVNHHSKYNWSRSYEKIKLEFHINQNLKMRILSPTKLTSKETLKLSSIEIADWGKVSEFDISIEADYFYLVVSYENFGYYKVKGTCNNTNLRSYGSCFFMTDSLVSKECSVKHFGIGDVYVNFTSSLKVWLEFTGNVYYKGNPSDIILEQQLSSGKLIPIDSKK